MIPSRQVCAFIFSPSLLAVTVTALVSTATAQTYHRPILFENQPIIDPHDPDGEDQQGVMTREYSDFLPAGIKVGSFIFTPRLLSDLGYTDNLYVQKKQTKSTPIGVLGLETRLKSLWSRHAFEVNSRVEAKRYFEAKSENVENYHLTVGGQYDLSSVSNVTALVKSARNHDLRGDPDSITQAGEPVAYDHLAGNVGFNQGFGRFILQLGSAVKNYQYDSSLRRNGRRINGKQQNFTMLGETARLNYELTPGVRGFGEVGWLERTYAHPPGNGLKSRNSTGPEVSGGATFALGALWSGEAAIGYAERRVEDKSFGAASAMIARLHLLWNVTRNTSLRLHTLRQLGEAASAPSSVYVGTSYWFGIEHQLQSDLILGANISTRNINYVHSPAEANILSAGMRATWFINRDYHIQTEYNFSRRTGNQKDADFSRNTVMLRFIASL